MSGYVAYDKSLEAEFRGGRKFEPTQVRTEDILAESGISRMGNAFIRKSLCRVGFLHPPNLHVKNLWRSSAKLGDSRGRTRSYVLWQHRRSAGV